MSSTTLEEWIPSRDSLLCIFFFRALKSVFVLVGVAVSWTCSTQFSKSALTTDKEHFFAPYSMVWFNTSFMTICYPVFLLYNCLYKNKSFVVSNEDSAQVFGAAGFTWRSFFLRETPFIVLWVIANYAYSRALGPITASAAASIFSSNTCVVCVLGWFLLKEPFSILKLIAVVMAVGGVYVITLDKEFGGTIFGIILVVLCAITAGFYKVLFKLVNGDANLGQVSMFMSGLGVINIFLNIIPTLALNYFDVDHIEWDYVPWAYLIGTALLSLLFNFFVNFGIALLNPLVISVGMLVGLPLSTAIDIVFRGMTLTPKFAFGTGLIIVSFALTAFPVEKWIRGVFSSNAKVHDGDDEETRTSNRSTTIEHQNST